MNAQLTWNNDPALKARAASNLRSHLEEDTLRRGEGYLCLNMAGTRVRGCALGCTVIGQDLEEYRRHLGISTIRDWRQFTAGIYGLPSWLTALEEGVFEHLPRADAPGWPLPFVEAIPVGVPFRELEIRVRNPLAREFCQWGEGILCGNAPTCGHFACANVDAALASGWQHQAQEMAARCLELLRGFAAPALDAEDELRRLRRDLVDAATGPAASAGRKAREAVERHDARVAEVAP